MVGVDQCRLGGGEAMVDEERARPDLPECLTPRELRQQPGFGVGQAEELVGVVDLAGGLAVDDRVSVSARSPSARRT